MEAQAVALLAAMLGHVGAIHPVISWGTAVKALSIHVLWKVPTSDSCSVYKPGLFQDCYSLQGFALKGKSDLLMGQMKPMAWLKFV